jgi:hypothetical protein
MALDCPPPPEKKRRRETGKGLFIVSSGRKKYTEREREREREKKKKKLYFKEAVWFYSYG